MGTYNKQTVKISGDRNIVGSHNSVNSRHEEHHHHHHRRVVSNSKSTDDATGAGLGIIFTLVTICWFFAKNSEVVYFYLQLAACISFVPAIAAWLLAIAGKDATNKHLAAICYGLIVAFAAFMLALSGEARLNPAILELSQTAKNGWEFWQGLSEYGHNAVIGSLVSAVCIGGTIVFNFLMGLFITWHLIAPDYLDNNLIFRFLNPFRPNRGGILIALLLAVAVGFQFGFVFDFLKSLHS